MEETSTLLFIIPILAGVFLTIVWIVLPFAVFGIKGKLDGINSRLSMTIWRLNKIIELLEAKVPETPPGGNDNESIDHGEIQND